MHSSNAKTQPSERTEVNHVLVKVSGGKSQSGFSRSSGTYRATTQWRWSGLYPMYMSHRWRIPVIFGFSVVIFAITFIGLVFVLASSQPSEAATDPRKKIVFVERETPVESIAVLIPVKDIRKGQKLEPDLFTTVARPKVAVPVTVITSVEQLKGAYARANLLKDQPIAQEMVQGVKPLNPVIASILPGYRAITINVNATSSVEGWATAGAYVDVQWVTMMGSEKTATIIAQNAKILSAERQTDEKNQSAPVPTTITLLVSDKDAERVSLASNSGQLILHLRGTEDQNKGIRTTTLTLRDLYKTQSSGLTPGDAMLSVRDASGARHEYSVSEGKVVKDKDKVQDS